MSVARVSEREYRSRTTRRDFHVVTENHNRASHAKNAYSTKVIGNVVIISLLVVAFLASIAFISVLWQISAVQKDISVLKTEIYEINRDNKNLESVISTAANIETVRENANLLGMSSPTEDQMHELYVGVDGVVSLSTSHNN